VSKNKQAAHAELGASSASRWMPCPGSVALCRTVPNRKSIWAAEGSAAHELGEMCLANNSNADEHLGLEIYIDEFPEPFIVDEEMADAVQVYLDHIRAIGQRPHATDDDPEWIETKVNMSAYADNSEDVLNEMFGTADYIRYLPRDRTLIVNDYKHGAGVEVFAEGNAQGRYYALGALAQLPNKSRIDKIEIQITQPRANPDEPVSVEVLDVVDLMDWSVDLFKAARRTQEPNAPLKAGKHCQFCPAQGICPEVRKNRMEAAQLIFRDQRIVPKKPIEKLSPEDLRQILDSAEDLVAFINAAQSLAHNMIEAGQTVPGYKIVAKRAMRKWRESETTANWLCTTFGFGDDQIYDKKIKSPAQVEKLLDKHGKKLLAATDLITAESSGNTLAQESDKRPAVAGRIQPEQVFAPVT
jgi:hypothetical protein